MENFKFSDKYCDKVIKYFSESNLLKPISNFERNHSMFIVKENSGFDWLWNDVNRLIQTNINSDHFLTLWISVLKYDKGNYFLSHEDSPNQNDNRFMSGGVELSKKDDFKGGEFVILNETVQFDRGSLISHNVTTPHEIKEVTNGTRWSLHFGINRRKSLV